MAAIKFRGSNAVTNFALSRYNVDAIANSELPIGVPSAKRMKKAIQAGKSELATVEYITNTEQAVGASTEEKRAVENYTTELVNTTPRTRYISTYNSVPATNGELSVGALAKWIKNIYEPNSYQLTLTSSNSSAHSTAEPSASLHNLSQFQSSAAEASVLPAYYCMGEACSDFCGQNLYWPLENSQHGSQLNCSQVAQGSEALQLTF